MKVSKNIDGSFNIILPDNRLYKIATLHQVYTTQFCGVVDIKKYKQGRKIKNIPMDLRIIGNALIHGSDQGFKTIYSTGVITK